MASDGMVLGMVESWAFNAKEAVDSRNRHMMLAHAQGISIDNIAKAAGMHPGEASEVLRKYEEEMALDGDRRWAVVHSGMAYDRDRFVKTIESYLPGNYEVIHNTLTTTPDGHQRVGITGIDRAGWTFDEYVQPRLLSGLYTSEECSDLEHVRDRTQGVMD